MHGRYGSLSPLLSLLALLSSSPPSSLLLYAKVLKEVAIPAIVTYTPHKQAENSMAGCCNNLP
jgi:hypothetical protein